MSYSHFKNIIVAILFVVSGFITKAQQTAEKFVLETQYLLYLPEQYAVDTATKWPLLIFLHGSGESGTDLDKVKVHGPPKLVEQGKKFPFIVVSPQAPPRAGWKVEILKQMLDDIKKRYRVDNDRVYLTGLSMGGFGTWNLSEKYPDEFAAIAPICGGGNAEQVWKLRHMPVWCFHGAKDDVVPSSASQTMVDALKKYNSNVKFTLYPDANHNSWDVTYNNDSLYSWLLAQKRFQFKPAAQPQSLLKEYEGIYVNNVNKDTVKMVVENEKLFAKLGKNSIALKASANNDFYWDDNSVDEVRFTRNSKDVVGGFILLADEKVEFRKLPVNKTVRTKQK
ncbi:prolyl oligopeptidase family serine peptidase [Terrimonas pollutisoli]|uniref:carboxylesterase family protein n=1 Tax=Terrimonas pollutisoli TaxID=3034147 RepID=UPI0023EE1A8C|nr:prolyl oligopeptidase family serine peptidase [Terrimonas sp. H1YJ31]